MRIIRNIADRKCLEENEKKSKQEVINVAYDRESVPAVGGNTKAKEGEEIKEEAEVKEERKSQKKKF